MIFSKFLSAQKRYLLFVLFLFLFVSIFLFPFKFRGNAEAMQRTMDMGHFIAFSCFSWFLYRLFLNWGDLNPLRTTFFCSLLLIFLIELIQPLFFRTASWIDVINGLCGLLVTSVGIWCWNTRQKPRVLGIYFLVSLIVFLFVSKPAAQAWYAVWWRHQQFPLLGDFEKRVALRLWQPTDRLDEDTAKVSFSEKYVSSGIHALKVETLRGAWSGVRYLAGSSKWGQFQSLKMEIYNPDLPFQLNLRIDDDQDTAQYGDRFDAVLPLSEGWNHVELSICEIEAGPKTRRLHMNAIHKMTLFTDLDAAPQVFYLDHVRLDQKKPEGKCNTGESPR